MRFLVLLASLVFSQLNVPLTVKDGANLGDASQYPVKLGVPLPIGQYDDVNRFRVTDATGNTVPAQFDVLGRYLPRSRSIRVVLVQFKADIVRNGTTRYFLKDDGAGNDAAGLALTEDTDKITVNAGTLRFEIKKSGFNLFDRLSYDANGNGVFETSEELISPDASNGAALTDTLGSATLGSAKTGLQVTVEERGPVRACIRVESPTDATLAGWGFDVRLYAYYNTPFITMDYFLKNSQYGPVGHNLYFSKFTLANKLQNLGTCTARLGGAIGTNAGAYEGALSSAVAVASTAWKAYSVNGTAGTGKCIGYADLSDATKGVMAVVRKFSEMHPCQLEIGADKSLNVNLMPQGRHLLVDETRAAHQVMLYFHPGSATQADLFLQAGLFQKWPVVLVQPKWYTESHAISDFGGFYTLDTAWNPGLYQMPGDIPAADTERKTGWRNWGGDVGRRWSYTVGGWPPFLGHFVMSGHPGHLYEADDLVRHESSLRPMWIDDYQFPRDRGLKVIGYPAGAGTRPPGGPSGDPDFWSSWDYQHAWVFRIAEYYFFTGERFCADYLTQHADLYLNEDNFTTITGAPNSQTVDMHRGITEPMRTVLDAYKATGEERYWNYLYAYAKNMVDLYSTKAITGSKFGAYKRSGIQHGTVSIFVGDLYFLLPETTPEERAFKERYLLMLEGGSNGQIYWGGNHISGCDSSWGLNYDWSSDPYTRPAGGSYYTSYGYNQLGLMYFLTGRPAYRQMTGMFEHGYLMGNCASDSTNTINIFRMDAQRSDYIGLIGWYRLGTAAWYWPQLKTAPLPSRITDLSADASYNGRVLLKWTSVGGNGYKVHWAEKPIVEPTANLSAKCPAFPYPDTGWSVTQIYMTQAFDLNVTPKTSGQSEEYEIGPLPDSLNGRKIWFDVKAVNVVSEYDMSRGPLSNTDSIAFSTSALTGGPDVTINADVKNGLSPMTVNFTCATVSGTPVSWLWRFGDGVTSTEQNPAHTFDNPGLYSVTCMVKDGSNNGSTRVMEITASAGIAIAEAYAVSPTRIILALNTGMRLPSGASTRVAVREASTGRTVDISAAQIDTANYAVMALDVTGLREGVEYTITLPALMADLPNAVSPVSTTLTFTASFRSNPYTPRKIVCGPNGYNVGGWEASRYWDGDCGLNSACFRFSNTRVRDGADSVKRGFVYTDPGCEFGREWFKIRVSRQVKDYRLSLCTGAYSYAPDSISLRVEDSMVYDREPCAAAAKQFLILDSVPVRIEDGMLDVAWEILNYIALYPVYHFAALPFQDVSSELASMEGPRAPFLTSFPNPFNPSTTIRFSTGRESAVTLALYDVRGKLIRRLNVAQSPGTQSVAWDGRNATGGAVGSGLYIARLTAGKRVLNRRMVLVR